MERGEREGEREFRSVNKDEHFLIPWVISCGNVEKMSLYTGLNDHRPEQ